MKPHKRGFGSGKTKTERSKLLDSCAFALARPFHQIPSRPFFCIALTFSQLRTLLFPSRSFFPHRPFSTPFSFLLSGAFFFPFTFFYDPLSLPGPPCPLLSPLLCNEHAPILSRAPSSPPPSVSRNVFASISVSAHRIYHLEGAAIQSFTLGVASLQLEKKKHGEGKDANNRGREGGR